MTSRLIHQLYTSEKEDLAISAFELHSNRGWIIADLGPKAPGFKGGEGLATWLLERLGESFSGDPIEALRARIEREVTERRLRGCALVSPPPAEGTRGRGEVYVTAALPVALVLLSKSSDRLWIAGKTPLLDPGTLLRRIRTRDPRFATGRRKNEGNSP